MYMLTGFEQVKKFYINGHMDLLSFLSYLVHAKCVNIKFISIFFINKTFWFFNPFNPVVCCKESILLYFQIVQTKIRDKNLNDLKMETHVEYL